MVKKKAERSSRTHFEQIPLEAVKKIAETDVSKNEEAGTVKRKPTRAPARSRAKKQK